MHSKREQLAQSNIHQKAWIGAQQTTSEYKQVGTLKEDWENDNLLTMWAAS